MGSRHVSLLAARKDVEVLGVCDVREAKREQSRRAVEDAYGARERSNSAAKSLGLYSDFRELLARNDVDAVVVATPEHWHCIPSVEAAKAGKDVYCEKPMSHTVREGRAMADAVRRYERVFQTGSQQRSSPEFRFACEMVRSGRIGPLKSVEVYVGGPSGECSLPGVPEAPKGIDWDRWLGPAPWRPYSPVLCPPPSDDVPGGWMGYRDYGGGGMTDWGSHHFDIAQWGIGADETGPVEIIVPDGKDVKWLTYKYANGVTLTHGGPGSYSKIEGKRTGNDGIVFNGPDGKVEVTRGYLRTWPETLMKTPTRVDEVHLYESPGHYDDWLRSIRSRQRPICDVEIGHRSVSIGHLGSIAYRLGRSLKWDPARETFLDDSEADRLLSYANRPWS
jgi:predicted dehydrogenase